MSLFIWATFVRKFVTKNLGKSPNLVTLLPTYVANSVILVMELFSRQR